MPTPFIRQLHQPSLDALEALRVKIAASRQQFAVRWQKIDCDPDLTLEAKGRGRAALKTALNVQIHAHEAEMQELRATVDAAGQRKPTADRGVEVVTEQRKAAAWRRIEAELRAGSTIGEAVDQARTSADPSLLAALRDELPSYLTIAAAQGKTVLEAATSRKEAAAQWQQIASQLDVIEGQSGSTEAAGRAQLRALLSPALLGLDTELRGAKLDAQGDNPAGERRIAEAYANNEAESVSVATDLAFNASNSATE